MSKTETSLHKKHAHREEHHTELGGTQKKLGLLIVLLLLKAESCKHFMSLLCKSTKPGDQFNELFPDISVM